MDTIVIDGTTEQGIAAYEPFRAQLAEMKATNANAVFHYETPKGNAAARSHIYGIRKVRAALESARKEAKAYFLEQGRKVDSEAKEIQAELDAMIAVHEAPLLEIEQREKARVAAIRERIQLIDDQRELCGDESAALLRKTLDEVSAFVVDDTFEEFKAEAVGKHTLAVQHLTAALAVAEKREAEEAELARLRAEQAAREQQEREDRIRAEAAAKAKAEAEAKAKAEAEKAEAEARAREKAIQDEADRRVREAQAEQDRQAAEAARIERERLAREADKKHRADVIATAEATLSTFISLNDAREAIAAIVAGKIPNVKVVF